MLIEIRVDSAPKPEADYYKRVEGPDQGLIAAWLCGLEKGRSDPLIAKRARCGELPPTPFKGGFDKPLKTSQIKIGAVHYIAYWQGLRGDDLHIDTQLEPQMTCAATGVTCFYTMDAKRLLNADNSEADHD